MLLSKRCVGCFLLMLLGVFLTGCESQPPSIPIGEAAIVDADGLHKVENNQAAVIFIDPDADFSTYKRFYLKEKLPIGYSAQNRYEFTAEQHDEVKRLFHTALRTALTNIGLQETNSSTGEGTLVIAAALDRVLVNARPEPAGRSRVYVESTGKMTLLLQVSAGNDARPLIRFFEARQVGALVRRSTSVTVRADLSRVFNRWAQRLAHGLTLSPADFTVLEEQG